MEKVDDRFLARFGKAKGSTELAKEKVAEDHGLTYEEVVFLAPDASFCYACEHFGGYGEGDIETGICSAYPGGIPAEVFLTNHYQEQPGDNGIQFKAAKGYEMYKTQEYTQKVWDWADAEYDRRTSPYL